MLAGAGRCRTCPTDPATEGPAQLTALTVLFTVEGGYGFGPHGFTGHSPGERQQTLLRARRLSRRMGTRSHRAPGTAPVSHPGSAALARGHPDRGTRSAPRSPARHDPSASAA